MIVIEAVRTNCWNAIAGQRNIVTVARCVTELTAGDRSTAGYVEVTKAHLARISVEDVDPIEVASLILKCPQANGLDAGERELLAHATGRKDAFVIATCDKAALRSADAVGLIGQTVSLEELAASVGVRPNHAFQPQFTSARLRLWRSGLASGLII